MCLYALFAAIVVLCGVLGKDKWYNVVCSVVAVVYLLLLADGKRLGYLLGGAYALGYAVIAFFATLYATAAYHAFALLPTMIYRLTMAKKKEISANISKLGIKGWVISVCTGAAAAVGLHFLLKFIGDAQPLLDGAVLAVSLVTVALMFFNYMEMWIFNLAGSLLYVIIWSVQFSRTGEGLAFAVMQTAVSVINVRGLVQWFKNYRKGVSATERTE